jgi:hypothetical protein
VVDAPESMTIVSLAFSASLEIYAVEAAYDWAVTKAVSFS